MLPGPSTILQKGTLRVLGRPREGTGLRLAVLSPITTRRGTITLRNWKEEEDAEEDEEEVINSKVGRKAILKTLTTAEEVQYP